MTEKDLLRILSDLGDDEFIKFKWYLKLEKVDDIEPIKESQLSNADRLKVVDLMVQKYEFAAAVTVIKNILSEINRKDLVRKLPNIDTGEGLGMHPPRPMNATGREDTEMPVQGCNSSPLHLLGLSPSLKGQETDSHRYGISGQPPSQITASSTSQCDNKENMLEAGNQFKTPTKRVLRSRARSFNSGQSKEALVHYPGSAPARMRSSPARQMECYDSSPMFLRGSSLTTSLNNEDDDGFLDELHLNKEPVMRYQPRSLFNSPSKPSTVSRPSAKRPDRPGDNNTPVKVKRRCSLAGTHITNTEQNPGSQTMMALASPSTFAVINDPEVESVRQEFQLLTYACRDRAVTRQELYKRSIEVNGKAMDLLVRQVLLRRAAEQKLANMQQELCDTQLKLEVMQASACFVKDDEMTSSKV